MQKPIVYLSGGMERAPKPHIWRANMTDFIQRELKGEIRCPVDAESKTILPPDYDKLRVDDPDLYRKIGRRYIQNRDMQLLGESNILLAKYDQFAGPGTDGEIHHAYWTQKIPVIIKIDHPVTLSNLPGWIYWCSTEIFHEWDALKQYMVDSFCKKEIEEINEARR